MYGQYTPVFPAGLSELLFRFPSLREEPLDARNPFRDLCLGVLVGDLFHGQCTVSRQLREPRLKCAQKPRLVRVSD